MVSDSEFSTAAFAFNETLIPDVFSTLGKVDREAVFAHIVNADDTTSLVADVSRAQLLEDVGKAAAYLRESGCEPRSPGSPAQVIGFLTSSGYIYFVYELGALLLGWTVR
jgi:hypothetical protein